MAHVAFLNLLLALVGVGMSFAFVRLTLAYPGWGPAMALGGLLVALVTLVQPRAGLYLLVYSMLLSPGFAAGQVGGRAIEVRLDDVFLLLVFVAWFAITTLRRGALVGLNVPLIRPMAAYVAVAAVSSLMGIVREDIGYRSTFFFWLKYAQYYMLYYMTYHMVDRFERAKPYLVAGLVTAAVVLAHAYRIMAAGGRPYPPFDIERGVAETATLGGYLVIIIGLAGGVALYARDHRLRAAMGVLILACIPPILSTGSRASYLAAAGVFAAMLALGRGRRAVLVLSGLLAFYIIPTAFRSAVGGARERVQYTFTETGGGQTVRVLGRDVQLESSAAARYRQVWKLWNVWLRERPLLGYGVTGVGLVDVQIPRVIGEVGLVGFACWAALMWGLLARVYDLWQRVEDPLAKGLSFGFLCVYIGLLVQSVGVNTFIIIRLMEPFWFMAAVVMRLYVETGPRVEAGPAFRRAQRTEAAA